MKIIFLSLFSLIMTFSLFSSQKEKIEDEKSNFLKQATSIILDFVPGISNVKNLGEAITGKDLITGKQLTTWERTFSLIGSIPFGNYFKNAKDLKKANKFYKASNRASILNELKNALNFGKAGDRALRKANFIPNAIDKIVKTGKWLFSYSNNPSDRILIKFYNWL